MSKSWPELSGFRASGVDVLTAETVLHIKTGFERILSPSYLDNNVLSTQNSSLKLVLRVETDAIFKIVKCHGSKSLKTSQATKYFAQDVRAIPTRTISQLLTVLSWSSCVSGVYCHSNSIPIACHSPKIKMAFENRGRTRTTSFYFASSVYAFAELCQKAATC